LLGHILGLSLPKRALETSVGQDSQQVTAFYQQKAPPPSDQESAILVVQADGKGVPMQRPEPVPPTARRGKGDKRTKKKEAVVTTLYSIDPYRRSPQQVVTALLPTQAGASGESAAENKRPAPRAKQVHATLQGKAVAFDQLTKQVAKRDGPHIQQRVALTDGASALQTQMTEQLPRFTLVLDLIHAIEYLWTGANALFGETHPKRKHWVAQQLLKLLSGETQTVIDTLQKLANDPTRTAPTRRTLNQVSAYYQRNQPYISSLAKIRV